MGLNDITLNDLASTDTAVVWALRGGEAVGGLWCVCQSLAPLNPFSVLRREAYPAEGPVVEVEQGVLLLETEPGDVRGVLLHQLGCLVAVVELVRCAVGHPALGEHENVVTALGAEWVGVNSDGFQIDIAVVARGLAG